jgi:hypothetical protein
MSEVLAALAVAKMQLPALAGPFFEGAVKRFLDEPQAVLVVTAMLTAAAKVRGSWSLE